MSRIWAVARLTISEAIRQKIAIVFILMMVVVLAALPFVMRGDNTLTGRVRTFLSYSMSSLGFLLGMLTVFLACGAIALEITTRQVYMTGTKPLSRWQLLAGKFLGIALLDLVLLLAGTGIVYGVVRYLRTLPAINRDDQMALENEVLAARGGITMEPEDFSAEIDERFERMRELGQIVDPDERTARQVKKDILRNLIADSHRAYFGTSRVHVFHNVLVDRKRSDFLHLRYKFSCVPRPPRE